MEKILLQIGLLPKEAKVYLASLHLGSQPASVIARRSGIHRTTVYDVFKSLIRKGLATKTEKGSATYFQVLDPENLLSYLEREQREYSKKIDQQKEEIAHIIPVLKSLENPLSSKPKVKFFEGEKGMREAYDDTLTSTEPIRAYANVEEMHKAMPNFFPEYYSRRREAGISIQAILPDNALCRERVQHNSKEARKAKLVSAEKYSFSPELDIYDDKVLITSFREKMAIMIQSKEIAELHKKMYDLLWDTLPSS
ncbi:hypothetical protein K9M59_01585 [Candidatus Gracilibacteria bacterium]|nr:hypothetical protein [Candidatus Gracilibacteria bacterium]MCF7819773.1 hypothetical protein [Candidatus Gracilibacteria bacterium]